MKGPKPITIPLHFLGHAKSNVELSMIRSWLGHESLETTSSYVEIDLEMMKRKTLQSPEEWGKENPPYSS